MSTNLGKLIIRHDGQGSTNLPLPAWMVPAYLAANFMILAIEGVPAAFRANNI
ncbi:hypothetical protein AAKU55_001182 [Oxalobacteraceae bacterium GrIS 1.11]